MTQAEIDIEEEAILFYQRRHLLNERIKKQGRHTHEQIAALLGLSKVRIGQILYSAMAKAAKNGACLKKLGMI